MSAPATFGVIGLGTMGANLALNAEDHGFPVAVWDIDAARTRAFVADHRDRRFTGAADIAGLVSTLTRPRRILLMIPAGRPVESTLDELSDFLEPGDIVIDGGNSNFHDTRRRAEEQADLDLHLFGLGVSGGAEGARYGPSLMPGGPAEAYGEIRELLEAIAARTEAGPCVGYLGPDGAGHFVKMVHNGIEYADMQAIAEAYDVLKRGLRLPTAEMAARFAEWNEGPLESYLLEITAGILSVTDESTGEPLVEQILDAAEQKGTGRWTAVNALELGVPAPSITAAVDARVLSSRKTERIRASEAIGGPAPQAGGAADPGDRIGAVADALYASRICAFAQGMDLIGAGSAEYGWEIPRAEVARIWMGGCIIRSRLLEPIRAAFERRPGLENLLLDPEIGDLLEAAQAGWRRALALAQERGIPAPCWSAALAYFDAYRTAGLPQNLTQAQRDWFGAHTYHRLDDPGGQAVHTDWESLAARAGGVTRAGATPSERTAP
ncbi:MAG TPA: NADP-dependent phosphogluconate dehydrogenase [Gemmatimonadota bacterium]|nr:NADP-dependent phosphogluconate dehydrogenase [Gemmatimonadota bacterium]